jgi:hypothetical protein
MPEELPNSLSIRSSAPGIAEKWGLSVFSAKRLAVIQHNCAGSRVKKEQGGAGMPLHLGAAEFHFVMTFGLRDGAAVDFESVRMGRRISQLALGAA